MNNIKVINALKALEKEVIELNKNDFEETFFILEVEEGTFIIDEICTSRWFEDAKRFNNMEDVSRFKCHNSDYANARVRKVSAIYNFMD